MVKGGDIISDGTGTVIMFDFVSKKNPDLDRAGVEALMRDYYIVRVDMPSVAPDDPAFPSYVNSLSLNGSIIVPIYGKPEDSKALEVIGKAMGGRRVVPIDFSGYPVGAIHCQAKEVFAAGPENR